MTLLIWPLVMAAAYGFPGPSWIDNSNKDDWRVAIGGISTRCFGEQRLSTTVATCSGTHRAAMPAQDDVQRIDSILVDSDILVPISHLPVEHKTQTRSAVAARDVTKWPAGTVPFLIDQELPVPERISNAIAYWNRTLVGVVKLVPRTHEQAYVHFVRSALQDQCASYVGMLGGKQDLYLGDQCDEGSVIHEIGHVVGLWHEHSRSDRDTYIKVHEENVEPSARFQLAKREGEDHTLGPYDYSSVMHYGPDAFSINGLPTIETIPPGIPIGQRSRLSALDVFSVRAMYGKPRYDSSANRTVVVISPNVEEIAYTVDGIMYTGTQVFEWTAGMKHILSGPSSSVTSTRHVFISWSDGGAATHEFIVPDRDMVLQLNCAMQYLVTAEADGPGYVFLSPLAVDGFYAAGGTVGVQAESDPGYCFVTWVDGDSLSSRSPSTTLRVNKPVHVAAVFRPGTVSVTPRVLRVSRTGGLYQLYVQTTYGCSWEMKVPVWVNVRQNVVTQSGALTLAVDKNESGAPRLAFIQLGLNTIVIEQDR